MSCARTHARLGGGNRRSARRAIGSSASSRRRRVDVVRALPSDVVGSLAPVAELGSTRSTSDSSGRSCAGGGTAVASKVVGSTAGAADDTGATSSGSSSAGALRTLPGEVRASAGVAGLVGYRGATNSSTASSSGSGSSTGDAGRLRAVGLDVARSSAAVALLVVVGARVGAGARLVARLSAHEAQTGGRGARVCQVAEAAADEAGATTVRVGGGHLSGRSEGWMQRERVSDWLIGPYRRCSCSARPLTFCLV